MCKIISQLSFFYNEEIENLGDLERLNLVIENIDDSKLVKKLRDIRGNGRNDFPVGAMLNSIYAMMIYGHNSISSLIRELSRNSQLRKICGFIPFWRKDKYGNPRLITHPNNRAYTNFLNNLKECEQEYEEIFNGLVKYMQENLGNFGERLAGDGKLINSYAKHVNKNEKEDGRRDLDADYTVKEYTVSNKKGEIVSKKKIYFGFRIHAVVDVKTELPVAISVTKASISERPEMIEIIKNLKDEHPSIIENTEYFLADKSYDFTEMLNELRRNGIIPIIDIKNHWQSGEETKQYKKKI